MTMLPEAVWLTRGNRVRPCFQQRHMTREGVEVKHAPGPATDESFRPGAPTPGRWQSYTSAGGGRGSRGNGEEKGTRLQPIPKPQYAAMPMLSLPKTHGDWPGACATGERRSKLVSCNHPTRRQTTCLTLACLAQAKGDGCNVAHRQQF
jgi:hypothetical protein